MTNDEYIKFLEQKGEGYVWQFTKQETGFDKIFLATKLFSEWKKGSQSINLENFFSEQYEYEKYNITDRHRTLIIAQLYGLITKNNSTYAKEDTTVVFDKLNYCTDALLYRKIVTEQILKVKLPALTVSRANDNEEKRHIFPVIFMYQVLKKLKQYKISSIKIDELYTYVLTANFHSDLERVVTDLTQPIKPLVNPHLLDKYKKRSRIIPLIKNINLFNIVDKSISINSIYEDVMDSFLSHYLPLFMQTKWTDNEIYKNFLYEFQNFNINLIDEDNEIVVISEDSDDIIEDVEYTENVALQSFETVNKQINTEPQLIQTGNKDIIRRDPALGAIAINNSGYQCENDNNHQSFISKRTKKPYMEAHHLIPISQSQYMWKKKHKNIDCIENIVSLCPTCHKAIHLGEFDTKLQILKKLYDKKIEDLRKAGIDIDFETLLKFYL